MRLPSPTGGAVTRKNMAEPMGRSDQAVNAPITAAGTTNASRINAVMEIEDAARIASTAQSQRLRMASFGGTVMAGTPNGEAEGPRGSV